MDFPLFIYVVVFSSYSSDGYLENAINLEKYLFIILGLNMVCIFINILVHKFWLMRPLPSVSGPLHSLGIFNHCFEHYILLMELLKLSSPLFFFL